MKGFGGGGMQQLMRQANQMQTRMKKVQEELNLREFEGTSGGGALSVALQQIGLKLDARKAPLDVLVIDDALKTPTDN